MHGAETRGMNESTGNQRMRRRGFLGLLAATGIAAITEGCVIYGSAKTFLDKLIALRDEVGPFGALLMTGLDWSGPNGAWERESMRLLAEEVMPKFRQHATAQAAE